jgi:glyoxylate carboligase
VPGDGSATAAAVETARKGMLHDARDLKRTRIGADVLCEALLRQGVDVFFSYPGGVILPLYDVLGDYPELRHVLVRHEQGGAHAADGYARVTGRVGVCMGTSGPGATNLVTGIGTALLDSVPMVAITGNVPSALIGKDAFQEIDINGITLPMTKHNYLVRDADDLPRVIAEAFHIARSGRPGPVHVDITKDALQQETRAEHPSEAEVIAGLPGFRPNLDGHTRQLKSAAGEIAAAQRPVILAGHGVLHAEAWDDLRAFAEKTSIPVAWTLLGIGAMDETHPLAYGYMGMHGWKHVNRAIQSADLLIAIGMRFDDRVTGNVRTYAPYARIIHVDIDPTEIGKNVAVEVPIVGGAGPDGPRDVDRRSTSLSRPAGRLAARLGGVVVARLRCLARRRPVGRLRGRADRRADRPPGDLRGRRRPEPDVAGSLCRLSQPEQPCQFRRAWPDGIQRAGGDGCGPRSTGPRDLGDHRRRRLPDDLPGTDDPRGRPHPGQDRAARQQEARDDPPVAGDHLRRQLPLVEPART